MFVCYIEKFTKEDLKPGMIIETKVGYRFLVIDNYAIGLNYYLQFNNLYDNLTSEITKNNDIVKVYQLKELTTFANMINNCESYCELIAEINK